MIHLARQSCERHLEVVDLDVDLGHLSEALSDGPEALVEAVHARWHRANNSDIELPEFSFVLLYGNIDCVSARRHCVDEALESPPHGGEPIHHVLDLLSHGVDRRVQRHVDLLMG